MIDNYLDKFVAKYGRLPTEFDPDYLEMLQMSKYSILDVPSVSPGKCGNCGSSKNDGRKYIDIGLHIDWYGAMYLCGYCVEDIARSAGLFDKVEADLREASESVAKIEEMYQKGEALHELVANTHQDFKEFYGSLHTTELDSDSDNNIGVDTNSPINKSRTDLSEPGVTESTSVTRHQNVPSLADLLNRSDL